jgi:hypothetical protein
MLSPELVAGNMIRAHGLALRKFNGGDGPLAIVAPDRDSQTVMLVKPNLLHVPGLSIGEDYGLADKLRPGLIERAKDVNARTFASGMDDWGIRGSTMKFTRV